MKASLVLNNEETPLIQEEQQTPLPWFQFFIVIVLQFAEPLTLSVITPFAPQLIRDIKISGGDESQVGYYVGIMQSSFYLAETLTVLLWSRVSDRIGRKPVILSGLLGLSLSMYCFGLSKTFPALVLSRLLNGTLNGNIGVIKSTIAELTDSTNISVAYAYLPLTWSLGYTMGPIIGGVLSNPAVEFPIFFGNNKFLKEYPYFLPCATSATLTLVIWITALIFLKETHPRPMPVIQFLGLRKTNSNLSHAESDMDVNKIIEAEDSHSLGSLLTYEVVVSSANYALLSLMEISFRTIYPVFLSTPINFGGLGLPPRMIGKILSTRELSIAIFQICFFARISKRWGTKKVFMGGLVSSLPAFALFPIISSLVRHQGHSFTFWAAVGSQIMFTVFWNMSFGAIFIFITAASPSHGSLGATIGFSQTTVSFMRAVGPAAASSLFSLSVGKGYLGGYLVYYALMFGVIISLVVGSLLPEQVGRSQ